MCLNLYVTLICFLVLDSRLLTDAGGDVLLTKIPTTHKSMAVTLGPGIFQLIDEGSLLTVDNIVIRRRRFPRAPKDEAGPEAGTVAEGPEAEAVAEAAIAAEMVPAVEAAIVAEVVPAAEAAIAAEVVPAAEAAQAVGQQ